MKNLIDFKRCVHTYCLTFIVNLAALNFDIAQNFHYNLAIYKADILVLKYGSEEKSSWFYKCSILLGFIMSKKQERLRSELLSEDKITNLLGFLT